MIMLQPGPDLFRSIALVPLLGTVFFAVTMIVLRKPGRTETSASVAFTFPLSCTLLSGFALPSLWISPYTLALAALIAGRLPGRVAQPPFNHALRSLPSGK